MENVRGLLTANQGDAFGQVIDALADGGFDTGFVSAEIDPVQVTEARAKIPSLDHDRDFE